MRLRRSTVLAGALLGYALTCGIGAATFGLLSGRSWDWLVDNFVVTNAIIGTALAVAGWPIAHYRPRNAIGWLLLTGGCGYLTSASGQVLLAYAGSRGGEGWVWGLVATAVNTGFAWPVCFCIPLAVLLFPDGRFPSRWWRITLVAPVVGLLAWHVTTWFWRRGALATSTGFADLVPDVLGNSTGLQLNAVAGVAIFVSYASGLVSLVVRYWRGSERVRRQILWVLLAVGGVLLASVVSSLIPGESIWSIVPLVLIPLSITVAVLRHQLLDIRLVVSRSLLYVVLTGAVVVAYSGLVVMIDWLFRREVPGVPVIAALAIAIGFHPVRVVLQRWIDGLLYGARRDPVRALAEVGSRLGDAGTVAGLDGVLESLCRVLRLPAAVIVADGGTIAGYGDLPAARHVVPLTQGDDAVGELVVGLRPGEGQLGTADAKVLTVLAAPVGVAVHANLLAAEVQRSRERVISGREEERRRLRRDLHDGLGPVLSSVVLNADAARHLLRSDPARAGELLDRLRDQTTGAVDEIRRLVYELRPPSLDELGLAGALREYALGLTRHADGTPLSVGLEFGELRSELPAAVEVAAYRIVTEALNNVARHSSAGTATVRLASDPDAVRIEVRDDGVTDGAWQPGVGMTSIRERATELRGTSEIRLGADGGLVRVVLPLVGAAS